MSATAFHVMVMLPSFAFAFFVLATFYGGRRAYLALCWMPAALFVQVNVLWQLSAYQPSPVNWPVVSQSVVWTGIVQCALGVVLAARAVWRGQSYVGLLLAACLAAAPYLLGARI